MKTATDRMNHATAESANRSPSAPSPPSQSTIAKQQLRKRLLEMIVKREAERRAPPHAAGGTA